MCAPRISAFDGTGSGAVLGPVEDPDDDHLVLPNLIANDKTGLAEPHLGLALTTGDDTPRARVAFEPTDGVEDCAYCLTDGTRRPVGQSVDLEAEVEIGPAGQPDLQRRAFSFSSR
ncbi:MAG: hypothetical protein ACI9YM_001773 [Brevundimonas sp.]|jgi:hypothetical protein